MTAPLSARIAALEQRMQRGQAARELEGELQARLAELQRELSDVQKAVLDGEYAGRILNHLGEQVDRVLAGGEAMKETDAPPAEDTPTDSEAVHSPDPEPAPLSTPVVTAPVGAMDDDCAAVLATLQKIGYAVPPSALLNRLRHLGFDQHRVSVTASELVNRREIVRQPDGKYALPKWGRK